MAEGPGADDIFWVEPEQRGIFPIDSFHVPRSLARTIRRGLFDIKIDTDFDKVIRQCAAINISKGRAETWINDEIIRLYSTLFQQGHVHTVECWQDDRMVGGLYGVSVGGAFCGESMFHTVTDASKVALVYLLARLKVGGYSLLDAQFITPHLSRFGAIEIPRMVYRNRLQEALRTKGDFHLLSLDESPETVLQLTTQMS